MNKPKIVICLLSVLLVATIVLFGVAACTANENKDGEIYSVKFNGNGANDSVIEVGRDGVFTLPEDPQKAGYAFGGWYLDQGVWNQPFSADAKIEKDTEVYAKWTTLDYTLTFDLGGGNYAEGVSNPTSYTIESDDITLNPAVREGYAFDGWYVGGNGVSTIKKGNTGDISFVAKWVKDGYTITYTDTKGVENNNPRTYVISDGAIALSNLAKDGYRFDGWYIGDVKYTEIPANTTGNLTFRAKWTVVNYTITYLDPEGKVLDTEGFDLPTGYTIESNNITLNAYYIEGQRFGGWFDDDGILVTVIKKGSFGDVVLYANFEALPLLAINYVDRFNRPNENQILAEYGETVNLSPLKKADYDFVGWTLNGIDIVDSVEVFADMTLAAVWKQKEGLEDFDYVVDDNYIGYNKEGFIILLGVKNPSVTKLAVPECVSMVKNGLLRDCNSLESLTLPFIGESLSASSVSSHLAFLFGGNSYRDNAKCVPQSLKTLVVNGGEVADNALFGCEYLEKLIFNEGVTRIGDSAVANCTRLKELQVPFIGEKYCEDDDYNGISCEFPDNARFVYIFGGRYATEQFPKMLEKLSITKGYAPDPIMYYDRDKATRFYPMSSLSKLKEFDYTSVNDYLYDHMFEYIPKVEKLTIRGDVKKIGFFCGYTNSTDYIKEVNIPDTVTELSNKAFYRFKGISKLSIPNVQAISEEAFKDCERLISIEFCSELTSIGNEAFSGCSSLFSITIPKTVPRRSAGSPGSCRPSRRAVRSSSDRPAPARLPPRCSGPPHRNRPTGPFGA